jgi:thiol-disulfide isomerase/thioredoxin
MKRILLVAGVVSLLLASFLLDSGRAAEPPREAAAILKEYRAVQSPSFDQTKFGDQAYIRTFSDANRKATAKRNELALEFYRSYPKDARATELLLTRWRSMTGSDSAKADAEMEEFLKDHPDSKVKADVLYSRAMMAINTPRPDVTKGRDHADEFIQAYPKDERGAGLLMMVAMRSPNDREFQLTIYRRIAADYAGSRAAKMAEGSIRRVDAEGKPFELEFTDATTGQNVSMKALLGKVVVVDFWATWCGPCIAEMPKMKELYGKYKDQGVEFIGVSLDSPGEGLDKLKKYVEENEIAWPQYYQGNGWDSEFSLSWGINSIPALFVVDADGNVHSTAARSKLDSMIPELIKKRDQKT